MPALRADVVVRAQLVGLQRDAAARAVRRKEDLGQLVALDRDLLLVPLMTRQPSLRPPSTAMTWPVKKPARSRHRNRAAAPLSSAVPAALAGLSLTGRRTI